MGRRRHGPTGRLQRPPACSAISSRSMRSWNCRTRATSSGRRARNSSTTTAAPAPTRLELPSATAASVGAMRAEGEFEVSNFTPTSVVPTLDITTGVDVGVSTMEKTYTGAVEGRSATLFTSAYDTAAGVGTYVAMESFDGSLNGAPGHVQLRALRHHGRHRSVGRALRDRAVERHRRVVRHPGFGRVGGRPDGTHRTWFDYELD